MSFSRIVLVQVTFLAFLTLNTSRLTRFLHISIILTSNLTSNIGTGDTMTEGTNSTKYRTEA